MLSVNLRLFFSPMIKFLILFSSLFFFVNNINFAHETSVKQTEIGSEFSHHIELVLKTKDNQDLSYSKQVEIEIQDSESGNVVFKDDMHPMFGAFFHYGINVNLESDKDYKLNFKVHPQTFMRDSKTKNLWLDHIVFSVDLDTSNSFSELTEIGKHSTDEINANVLVTEGKSMYEVIFDGMQTDHHASKNDMNGPVSIIALIGAIFVSFVAGFILSLLITRRKVLDKQN